MITKDPGLHEGKSGSISRNPIGSPLPSREGFEGQRVLEGLLAHGWSCFPRLPIPEDSDEGKKYAIYSCGAASALNGIPLPKLLMRKI